MLWGTATKPVTRPSYHAVVRRVTTAGETTRQLELESADGHNLHFQAGQHILLRVAPEPRTGTAAFSIASRPQTNGRFDLCIQIDPKDEKYAWFSTLGPGTRIEFSGPFGSFKLRQPPDPLSAFIATGTGIAPLRAMLQQLFHEQPDSLAVLFYGARHEEEILYRNEFEDMTRRYSGFQFVPTLSQPPAGWTGLTGYVQQHLRHYLANKPGVHAYVCGAPRTVDSVRRHLREIGLAQSAISFEQYG
jgi:NAD(P)H-flavin reductase